MQVHPSASITPVRSSPLSPLTCRPALLSVLRSFASRVYKFLFSSCPVCYRLSRPFVSPSLGVFWCLLMLRLLLLGVILRDWKRPGHLHSLVISCSIPHPRTIGHASTIKPPTPPLPHPYSSPPPLPYLSYPHQLNLVGCGARKFCTSISHSS